MRVWGVVENATCVWELKRSICVSLRVSWQKIYSCLVQSLRVLHRLSWKLTTTGTSNGQASLTWDGQTSVRPPPPFLSPGVGETSLRWFATAKRRSVIVRSTLYINSVSGSLVLGRRGYTEVWPRRGQLLSKTLSLTLFLVACVWETGHRWNVTTKRSLTVRNTLYINCGFWLPGVGETGTLKCDREWVRLCPKHHVRLSICLSVSLSLSLSLSLCLCLSLSFSGETGPR